MAAHWVEQGYRGNAVFDAHCDDPAFGYRFLVDEGRVAGQPMAIRAAWRICSTNRWVERMRQADHIAVGPGGVFLLDSKRIGGSLTVDDQGATVRRLDDPDLSYNHPGSGHLLSLASQTHRRVLARTRMGPDPGSWTR